MIIGAKVGIHAIGADEDTSFMFKYMASSFVCLRYHSFNTIAFPRSNLPPIPVSLCSFHKMGHCAGQIHGDSDIAGLGVNINSPLISLMR